MTDAALPADRFVQSDFRVGRVLGAAARIFARNILKLGLVNAIAELPSLLLPHPAPADAYRDFDVFQFVAALSLMMLVNLLGQAIVTYGAFEDMRRRPVVLAVGLKVGFRRFLPLAGLGAIIWLAMAAAAMVGAGLFLVPGLKYASPLVAIPLVILLVMWSVALPICVVERLGALRSLRRSREMTKGHRWRMFGLLLVALIPSLLGGAVLGATLGAISIPNPSGSLLSAATQTIGLIWNALWTAFITVIFLASYRDLRVAREGIDTEQIAEVFE